jgi:hypothetical protein
MHAIDNPQSLKLPSPAAGRALPPSLLRRSRATYVSAVMLGTVAALRGQYQLHKHTRSCQTRQQQQSTSFGFEGATAETAAKPTQQCRLSPGADRALPTSLLHLNHATYVSAVVSGTPAAVSAPDSFVQHTHVIHTCTLRTTYGVKLCVNLPLTCCWPCTAY